MSPLNASGSRVHLDLRVPITRCSTPDKKSYAQVTKYSSPCADVVSCWKYLEASSNIRSKTTCNVHSDWNGPREFTRRSYCRCVTSGNRTWEANENRN